MKASETNQGWTPGPWVFAFGSVYQVTGNEDGLEDENENRIAMMDRSNPKTTPVERDNNARLIAAAPELVEAVREAAQWLRMTEDGSDFAIQDIFGQATFEMLLRWEKLVGKQAPGSWQPPVKVEGGAS